jgi:hypothetical protein
MEQLFASGTVAFLILAVMAVEAIILVLWLRRFPAMLMGIAAGACLVLALGAALQNRHWSSIAALLLLAFVFHLMEIWQWLQLAKRLPR